MNKTVRNGIKEDRDKYVANKIPTHMERFSAALFRHRKVAH
jgi:hypothetical protein